MPSTDPLKRRDKKAYEEDVRVLQTQPGIRSGQMKLACGIIWNVLKINRTPIEKEQFLHLATSVVEGQLLEDIVFADLKDILPNDCDIFKLEWDADPGEGAEFDVAVLDERDPASPRVSLFEIKHTRQIHGGEARHLKNLRAIAQVAEVFGKVVSRTLVYLGPTERRAVLLVNADEFLQTIGENPEDALFPQCSEKWKPLVALEPGMREALTPSDA